MMTMRIRATLMTGLASGLATLLGGCGLFHGSQGTSIENDGPPLPASAWIGRWNAPNGHYMDIMPAIGAGRFTVTIKDDGAYLLHYPARGVSNRVFFMRDGERVSIRKGIGDDTGVADLAGQTNCVILTDGDDGYCRAPETLDALPLTRGTYVEATQSCYQPDPASLLHFDGHQLQRSDEAACPAIIIGQQGVVFTLNRRCDRADSNPASPATETVTVASTQDFALAEPQGTGRGDTQLYTYCASYKLPLALQQPSE